MSVRKAYIVLLANLITSLLIAALDKVSFFSVKNVPTDGHEDDLAMTGVDFPPEIKKSATGSRTNIKLRMGP